MTSRNLLAIAVASDKVGFVVLRNEILVDWGLSVAVTCSKDKATYYFKNWLNTYTPDVIVLEKIGEKSAKGAKSRELVAYFAKMAAQTPTTLKRVPRIKRHYNKYIAAAHLAKSFPELKPWLPEQPPIWESEPRNTMIFEALDLALEALKNDIV